MTLSEKAYLAIRRDILQGVLVAEQPLRMADLSEAYKMGFSPLREALSRLQVERLVLAEALRGFKVAPMSVDELWDATSTRIQIEGEALRLSIKYGDDDWSASIVAALYHLKLQVDRAKVAKIDVWEVQSRHYAFHRALLAACRSPWRLEFFDRLYAATERYRLPALLGPGQSGQPDRDIQAEHSALADATLARDADVAVKLLAAHYEKTALAIGHKMQRSGSEI